jgi:general nucleoside transport system permease protein
MLIGVGLVLAFRAQFFNIGAEGQLLVGVVAGGAVALFAPGLGFLLLPAMFLAGFLGGAMWGAIPALLKLKLEVNEVITTLMLNYVAATLVEYLVGGPWKGSSAVGFNYTDTFPEAAWLPMLGSSRVHWPTLLLGILFAFSIAFLLARTRLGFRMRVLGESVNAAKYVGINPLSTTLWVALLSAGAAGLAGVGEIAGIHHKLFDPGQISSGYGYTAIIVAWLARGNPIGAILTALFLGVSFAAGDVMKVSLQLPANTTNVFNGTMLMFLIATEPLVKYRIRLGKRK